MNKESNDMKETVSRDINREYDIPFVESKDNSEGVEKSSAVGCNANNSNASVCSLNANNAASNDNSNYAGGFAQNFNLFHASQPSRLNMTDNLCGIAGTGQCEYDSVPYAETAESNVISIWDDLKLTCRQKRLKNMKRFFVNREIVIFSIERAIRRKIMTREKRWFLKNEEQVADKIIKELDSESYQVGNYRFKIIKGKGKDGKDRNAAILPLFDRCIQNVILTVLEQKMINMLTRNVYNNVKGRSMFSNDRRYCMVKRIGTYVNNHSDKQVLLTDVHHFYESLSNEVILAKLFEIVTCNFTRNLLYKVVSSIENTPIGDPLSPIFANLVMSDFDRIVVERFKPDFYAAFGDNRLFCGRKELLQKILSFQKSYYAGRFNLELKGDYQIRNIKDGFRFCKIDYKPGYKSIRAEMRRRAIRSASRLQSFAGYKGYLLKTDSTYLLKLIKNNLMELKNKQGFSIQPFKGSRVHFDEFIGQKIAITDYRKIENHKDSDYYYDFQIIARKNGQMMLYHAHNGSYEIKKLFDKLSEEKVKLPLYVTVQKENNSFFFAEYHTTDKEACDIICETLNIKDL